MWQALRMRGLKAGCKDRGGGAAWRPPGGRVLRGGAQECGLGTRLLQPQLAPPRWVQAMAQNLVEGLGSALRRPEACPCMRGAGGSFP